MNTAKQLLWLPTTREEKYKAKQAVDSFFVRLGDLAAAFVVFAGTSWLALGVARIRAGQRGVRARLARDSRSLLCAREPQAVGSRRLDAGRQVAGNREVRS